MATSNTSYSRRLVDDILARRDAVRETALPLATFPEDCPWTVEQMLDADFWPEVATAEA